MSKLNPTSPRAKSILWMLIVFAVGIDVAFLWQRAGGAYESEFGGHPDEAAHYVTGLFVRDAVTTLPEVVKKRSVAPLKAFAPEAPGGFYSHYPKVALGVWPPAFYIAQTGWTLPFGESRFSTLMLMATIAAAVAVLIFLALRDEIGIFGAFVAALLWLSAPLIRIYYGMVMAEMLCTFTMFAATIFWGRYMDARKMRDALCFALFAAAAILTKGTGIALILMVGASLLISKNWSLLRQRATWIAAALVAIIAGPWTWFFRNAGTQAGGWADNSGGLSLDFTLKAIPFYARHLALATGIAVAILALIGIYFRCVKSAENKGRWAALASLILGIYVLQCILPVGDEARHIIAATPALIVLAFAGTATLLAKFPAFTTAPQKSNALAAILIALLSLPVFAMTQVRKDTAGFTPLAEWIIANAPNSRVLVCSDAEGEGMLISEIAMRDQRPRVTIERASKTLVDPKGRTWSGNKLKERFDPDALLQYLTAGKIDYIILDSAVPEKRLAGYHDQLIRLIEDHPQHFWQIHETPITRNGELMHRPLRLLRITTHKKLLTP